VVKTHINHANKTAEIYVWGYVSEQARNENKKQLDERMFTVSSEQFDDYFAPTVIDPQGINHVKNAYLFIKTQQEFIGSEDV
jgi:hypothetical protein